MQKFINIALVFLEIFKVAKSTTFLRAFDTKKPDLNSVKRKKGDAHPINFDPLKFRRKS